MCCSQSPPKHPKTKGQPDELKLLLGHNWGMTLSRTWVQGETKLMKEVLPVARQTRHVEYPRYRLQGSHPTEWWHAMPSKDDPPKEQQLDLVADVEWEVRNFFLTSPSHVNSECFLVAGLAEVQKPANRECSTVRHYKTRGHEMYFFTSKKQVVIRVKK